MKALQEHKEIVAALTRRDPVAAEQKMRQHIRNARAYVEEQLQASAAEGAGGAVPLNGGPRKGKSAKGRVGSLKLAGGADL
jgi:hypothetical protein